MIASIQADKVHKGRWRKQRGLPHIVVDVDLGWIHGRALVVVGSGDCCRGGLVLLRARATSALPSPRRRLGTIAAMASQAQAATFWARAASS